MLYIKVSGSSANVYIELREAKNYISEFSFYKYIKINQFFFICHYLYSIIWIKNIPENISERPLLIYRLINSSKS